jgi:hypothetical protein
MGIAETGLERHGDGPPSGARARLLLRKGWVIWRAGRPLEAVPILERAVAEAREAGDRSVEAWALHDLGIAHNQAGRSAASLPLVRESLRLARELGDITLVMRAINNLSSVMVALGVDPSDIRPLAEEGLAIALRSGNRGFESWLAWQLAQLSELEGRLDDGLTFIDQAVGSARAVGDERGVAARTLTRAFLLAEHGRWDEAVALGYDEDRRPATMEEQERVWWRIWSAALTWRRDPHQALRRLHADMASITHEPLAGWSWVARMAFRTGDAAALGDAVAGLPAAEEGEGPVLPALRATVTALGCAPAEAAAALVHAAGELDAHGWVQVAHEASVDALLAASRAGLDTAPYEARIADIEARTGLRPILGPLPEERWMPRSAAAAPAAQG